MREKWARRVAILAGSLVVILAMIFAGLQNPVKPDPVVDDTVAPPEAPSNGKFSPIPAEKPDAPAKPAPAATVAQAPSSKIKAGQSVYVDQACARCHSIAGSGSPRSPLDGVGARLSEAEIRAWITPKKNVTGFQARHANIPITPAQREVLVMYLQSLR